MLRYSFLWFFTGAIKYPSSKRDAFIVLIYMDFLFLQSKKYLPPTYFSCPMGHTQSRLCIEIQIIQYTSGFVCVGLDSNHLPTFRTVQKLPKRQNGRTATTALPQWMQYARIPQLAQERQSRLLRDT